MALVFRRKLRKAAPSTLKVHFSENWIIPTQRMYLLAFIRFALFTVRFYYSASRGHKSYALFICSELTVKKSQCQSDSERVSLSRNFPVIW